MKALLTRMAICFYGMVTIGGTANWIWGIVNECKGSMAVATEAGGEGRVGRVVVGIPKSKPKRPGNVCELSQRVTAREKVTAW